MSTELLVLALAALGAGFVDAIVGGGGLIQVPALFAALPHQPPASLLGTNKVASVFGTATAALQYARRVAPPWRIALWGGLAAAAGSWGGAQTVALIDPRLFKPLILVLLVLVAIYTFRRRDFGSGAGPQLEERTALFRCLLIALGIGFYDGFLGPGTGSFFIFLFVRWLSFDFLRASCTAKILNAATNLAAIGVFASQGHILWATALVMAACNLSGAVLGSRLALARGTGFVRKVFLAVVCVLILRMAYDLLGG